MAAGIGGTVTPASGWKNTGSSVKITATPKTGYSFTGWSGTGTSSFSGTTNSVKPSGGGAQDGRRWLLYPQVVVFRALTITGPSTFNSLRWCRVAHLLRFLGS